MRCGYLAWGCEKRKLRRGTASICLVRHGTWLCASVSRSDSSHEADSPFHATTKISRILNASAVLMMGIIKGVNEAHNHDFMQEASEEHLGDQIMETMVSPWKHGSLLPNRSVYIVYGRGHSL